MSTWVRYTGANHGANHECSWSFVMLCARSVWILSRLVSPLYPGKYGVVPHMCVHCRDAALFEEGGDVKVRWCLCCCGPRFHSNPTVSRSRNHYTTVFCRASCNIPAGPHFVAFAVPPARVRLSAFRHRGRSRHCDNRHTDSSCCVHSQLISDDNASKVVTMHHLAVRLLCSS